MKLNEHQIELLEIKIMLLLIKYNLYFSCKILFNNKAICINDCDPIASLTIVYDVDPKDYILYPGIISLMHDGGDLRSDIILGEGTENDRRFIDELEMLLEENGLFVEAKNCYTESIYYINSDLDV